MGAAHAGTFYACPALYLEPAYNTTATTVAARTSAYEDYFSGEYERRGLSFGWNALLPWLMEGSDLDPDGIPDYPYAGGGTPPAEGQIWPRGA